MFISKMQSTSQASSSDPVRKVGILGHSYVNRLPFESPLQLPSFEVRKFGSSGAKVSNITQRSVWYSFLDYKPDLVLLMLGGNDINVNTQTTSLCHEIKNLAIMIEELTGANCMIMNIEPRLQPRDISPDLYNTYKNAVNRSLGRIPDSKSRIRGMGIEKEDLCHDGVHLSVIGNEKLMKRLLAICNEVR